MEGLPEFLNELKRRSPKFGEKVIDLFEEQDREGALPPKYKTLISMSLDAAMGHPEGVEELAEKARRQGATEEEINEAIQVVAVVCGIQGLATGSKAFKSEKR